MNRIVKFSILFVFIAGWGCTGYAQEKSAALRDESALREFILQVIRENPDVVYKAVSEQVRKQKEAAKRRELERRFAHRVKVEVAPSDPAKGPLDAPITIIEFTDFQCPYCARAASVIDDLFEQYPGKLKLVFKSNPLKFHKQAIPAARAALAANRQGKFWPYHDLLFDNYDNLTPELFTTLAEQLELDLPRFNRDRNSEQIASQVDGDRRLALSLGFTSTPTFVINGVVVVGAQRIGYFKEIVDRLLRP